MNTSRVAKRSGGFLTAALLAAAIALFATNAYAKKGGGFSGPGPDLVTVAQALTMKDDAPVTLKGVIVKSLGDEKYTFKDASGTINVEIDDDIWQGRTIGPDDVVIISGEVDKEWSGTTIDVSTLKKE